MSISTRRKPAYTLTALLCSVFAIGSATTAGATDVLGPDTEVHYGDLAIDTEEGASQLLKRIEWAAARVCSSVDHGTLASRANGKACREKLSAAAVTELNQPMLLAVYRSSRDASPRVAGLTK